MNNKDKTGVYYDSTKNKKYLLVYDNGKLVNQSELLEEDNDEDIDKPAEDEEELLPILKKDSSKRKEKEKEGEREILSEEVYNSNMYSSEKEIAYVSQMENNSLKLIHSNRHDSKQSSSAAMIAENYIDPVLLEKKSRSTPT